MKLFCKQVNHPYVVSYADSFTSEDGTLVMILAYAERGDLNMQIEEHKKRNEPFDPQTIVIWMAQCLVA